MSSNQTGSAIGAIATVVKVESQPEVELGPIIRVDRSVRPTYPEWTKTVMHPELENAGPSEYNVSTLDQWLHDDQKGGKRVKGDVIYEYLTATGEIKTCLGLRDLEEIQKKGIAFFRKYFKGKTVFGWAGIVRDSIGHLNAPCLRECSDRVVLLLDVIYDDWDDNGPALRFASGPRA